MPNELTIFVKYFTKDIPKLEKLKKGDWIDLRSAIDINLIKGQFSLIPLGVGMILPDGYEAHLAPRSSTFKNFGIIQTNSIGIIDNSYSGEEDEWKLPVIAVRDTKISKGDRICQFRILPKMPEVELKEAEHLNRISRGGFDSTGRR